MTLREVAALLETELRISRHCYQGKRWVSCGLERVEIRCGKSGGILSSEYGMGKTVEAAKKKYARLISGQLLVKNAYSSDRKELRIPGLVTV